MAAARCVERRDTCINSAAVFWERRHLAPFQPRQPALAGVGRLVRLRAAGSAVSADGGRPASPQPAPAGSPMWRRWRFKLVTASEASRTSTAGRLSHGTGTPARSHASARFRPSSSRSSQMETGTRHSRSYRCRPPAPRARHRSSGGKHSAAGWAPSRRPSLRRSGDALDRGLQDARRDVARAVELMHHRGQRRGPERRRTSVWVTATPNRRTLRPRAHLRALDPLLSSVPRGHTLAYREEQCHSTR